MINDLKLEDAQSAANLVSKFPNAGFQASKLSQAIEIANKMKKEKSTIYFTFTANMVASGLRGLFAELCKRKYVDVIITTAGALEHDFIRSFAPYELGDFQMDDTQLHKKGINRIGNILVPNERYELFEKKILPIFEKLWNEKKTISPSELAFEMGANVKDENSFLYWCSRNQIPVFCPGITDGAIGLQTYFFKQKRKDFGIDVTKDMNQLASITLNAEKTGGIILGGGISKHHAIGVNIMRGGFNYAVYITTAQPWDGSLSGARSTEAVSWGKISEKANHITVDGEATILFPLFIAGLILK
ncbi:deoxyhypusine synthase [Candidatus Micrarchaeota archaeon]|nr:deoxyhypusine synthase [Candidatus Micrarchaeota archaeon]